MRFRPFDIRSILGIFYRLPFENGDSVSRDCVENARENSRSFWKIISKEPLAHFLVAAFLIFLIFRLLNPISEDNGKTIRVSKSNLISYMQNRARIFDSRQFGEVFDGLTSTERANLTGAYVEDEALYREGKSLGLDKDDFITRLRIVQQMKMMTQSFSDNNFKISDNEIEKYFQNHKTSYAQPETVTFTHIFYSNEIRGDGKAMSSAVNDLHNLNKYKVPFENAMAYGDRAIFDVNYVGKDKNLITSHFGQKLAQDIFDLKPSTHQWQGPFRSPYGVHLIMISDHERSVVPPLSQIRKRVEEDLQEDMRDRQRAAGIRNIVSSYNVKLSDDLKIKSMKP